ncbi:hypothetical protein CLF_111750 [Clonorchis sinensis]|uniref:Uncharacterized protein n=1 Tax=Clonorchis sinensis TaxID=79923 RepID=G7YVA3_CLOSI|nr:hypothetical protein CLF_111750 [Clonorchis sinensis]
MRMNPLIHRFPALLYRRASRSTCWLLSRPMLVKHVVNIARKSLIVPQFSSVFTSARTYPSPLSCNPNHRTLCSATPTRNDVAVLTDMADSSDLDDTIQGKMYIEFTCKVSFSLAGPLILLHRNVTTGPVNTSLNMLTRREL